MPAHFNEVIPNLYQIPLWGSSAFLLLEEQVTVVDAGWRGNGRRVVGHLERLGRTPTEISHIISTHYHPDHIGGIAHLKSNSPGRVALHESEVPFVEPGNNPRLPNPVQHRLLSFCLNPLLSLFKPDQFPVDLPLQDGSQLGQLGGMEVVHTPGHTPGSISLHFPKAGLLMVGDALQYPKGKLELPAPLFSDDMAQAADSVRKLSQLDFDVMCFSHFPPIKGGASHRLREFAESLD